MAEFGGHLTATSDIAPSIFEVLANESLANGLRGGFKYFIRVLLNNNPERYRRIYRFHEEIYTAFDLLVQWSHLKKFSASFAENFYSLRRVSTNGAAKGDPKLPNRELYLSLFFLVGFPYLQTVFFMWYETLKQRDRAAARRNTLEKACLRLYPLLHLVLQMSSLLHQLSYAVGRSRVHSPLLRLSSCQLSNLTETDLTQMQESDQGAWNSSLGILVTALRSGVTLGAFVLQFLEWWYAQEGVPSLGSLPVPQPPNMPLTLKNGQCPLCERKFQNATLLSTSGVVFCYRCIHQELSKTPSCPVTKYPSSHQQLVKLYLPLD